VGYISVASQVELITAVNIKSSLLQVGIKKANLDYSREQRIGNQKICNILYLI